METIERLAQTGGRGLALKRQLQGELVEHPNCIRSHGHGLPEIRSRRCKATH